MFLERTYAMAVISHMYFLLVSMPHSTTNGGEKENENVFSFSSNRTLESYAYELTATEKPPYAILFISNGMSSCFLSAYFLLK